MKNQGFQRTIEGGDEFRGEGSETEPSGKGEEWERGRGKSGSEEGVRKE